MKPKPKLPWKWILVQMTLGFVVIWTIAKIGGPFWLYLVLAFGFGYATRGDVEEFWKPWWIERRAASQIVKEAQHQYVAERKEQEAKREQVGLDLTRVEDTIKLAVAQRKQKEAKREQAEADDRQAEAIVRLIEAQRKLGRP
jgi:hypothetical protein